MAEVKWIKITTDMFDNRKIKYIRKLPEGDSIVLIWVMLLTMAGRCNDRGRIWLTENIPYNAKLLANELGFEESTVILALDALESLCMIDRGGAHITIPGWEEHQNVDRLSEIREYNRLAKQKSRAKQKALQEVNDMSLTCQRGHDPEEEREEESEEEKEYHSFTQLDKLSIEEFNRYVSIVADAELKGHHYRKKTHYQAILDMAMKDRGLT